ncbi:hypothetical protein EI94DRAFT_1699701 [Lactarius quietus]|nr:hypothetical protein EI94DRAFT_1699701 [Lactarius quietus]
MPMKPIHHPDPTANGRKCPISPHRASNLCAIRKCAPLPRPAYRVPAHRGHCGDDEDNDSKDHLLHQGKGGGQWTQTLGAFLRAPRKEVLISLICWWNNIYTSNTVRMDSAGAIMRVQAEVKCLECEAAKQGPQTDEPEATGGSMTSIPSVEV